MLVPVSQAFPLQNTEFSSDQTVTVRRRMAKEHENYRATTDDNRGSAPTSIGQDVYVQYSDGQWYRGKVLQTHCVQSDRAYFIRYYGFFRRDDEWINEMDIHPVYKLKRGDRVFACWMGNGEAKNSWFPGVVQGFRTKTTGAKNLRGSREYHVRFDDGDEDRKLKEILVMPYEVSFSFCMLLCCAVAEFVGFDQ